MTSTNCYLLHADHVIELTHSEELVKYKELRDSKVAYAVITLENVKDTIIEKAKKVKICPHCAKEQYDLIFTKPTIFVEKTEVGER